MNHVAISETDVNGRSLDASDYLILCAILAFFFEGAVRKWVLPADHVLTYAVVVAKEFFVVFAMLLSDRSNFSNSLRFFQKYLFSFPLVISIFGCLLSSFNASSLVGATLSLKSAVLMPVFACLAGRAVKLRQFWPAVYVFAFCILSNVPLAILQFYSDQSAFINCYVGGSNDSVAATGFSSNVRATGTFSYLSGLGFASVLSMGVGVAVVRISGGSTLRFAIGVSLVFSAILLSLATVSRGPVFIVFGILALALCRSIVGIFGSVVVFSFLLVFFSEDRLDLSGESDWLTIVSSIVTRTKGADGIVDRLVQPWSDLYSVISDSPFGNGLGEGQSATRAFGSAAVVESDLARIVYEVGIIGLIGYLLIYYGAVYVLIVVAKRSSRDSASIIRGLALLSLLVLYTGVFFNHVSNAIFWGVFITGCTWSDWGRANEYK